MLRQKHVGFWALILACGLSFAACSDDNSSDSKDEAVNGEESSVGGDSQESGGDSQESGGDSAVETPKTLKLSKVKSIEHMGLYPNQIVIHGDYAYAVASGDNVVMRIQLDTFKVDSAYINLGQNANPYAMTFVNDDIYIVNSAANTLIKTSISAPETLSTLASAADGLNMPMDVAQNPFTQSIAVACADYDASYNASGKIVTVNNGSVSSEDSDLLEMKNITALYAVPDTEFMIAVGSGNYVYGSDYSIESTADSGVRVTDYSTVAAPVSETILKNEDVGKLAFLDESRVWIVGSSYSPTVRSIHYNKSGDYQTSKLTLGSGTGMFIPAAIDSKHAVLADFNSDKLYVLDLNDSDVRAWADGSEASAKAAAQAIQSTSLSLSSSSADRRGPISMAVDTKRAQILVLNSLSETLDIISYE